MFCQAQAAHGKGKAEAITLDGRIPSAALVSVDTDFRVRLDVQGQLRELAARQLVCWGAYRDSATRPLALLVDGSVLTGDLVELDGQSLTLSSQFMSDVTLPRGAVRGMIVLPPTASLRRDLLLARLEDSAAADRLFLTSGDVLTGRVSARRQEGGVSSGPSRWSVVLEGSEREVVVEMGSASAIVLGRAAALPQPLERRLLLGFEDGSLLVVREFERDGEWMQLTMLCGARLRAAAEGFWSAVTLVQPLSAAPFDYLSDRSVQSYKQIPFYLAQRPWRADHNVLGGRLRSGGQVYLKGIGMYPAAQLSYEVAPDDEAFHAELALDEQAGSGGSVVFRVFLARRDSATGQEAWQPAYTSPLIRGGQSPLPIAVDVRGAMRLTLIVEFADRGDELDYANWLNARVVRGE
jgi:hypothetical protein